MITDLSNTNSTVYNTFWKNFGKYIKVGIIEDEKNRNELVPLCRFYSSYTTNTTTSSTTSTTANELTSLPEYVARMPADQKFIYYVVGEILYYYSYTFSSTNTASSNIPIAPYSI